MVVGGRGKGTGHVAAALTLKPKARGYNSRCGRGQLFLSHADRQLAVVEIVELIGRGVLQIGFVQ